MRPVLVVGLAVLVLGLCHCSSDSVVLLIHVKDVTPEVSLLQVGAILDGKAATQRAEFTEQLSEVTIKLPRDGLVQGQLSVNLFGLAADRCMLSSGHNNTQVNADMPFTELDVILTPLPGKFCTVPKGTFTMGSPPGEAGRNSDEVQHMVTLSSDFLMAETEVTQRQYQNVMGFNPSASIGDTLPVNQVTWLDAVAYCNELSKKENLEPCYQINGGTVGWKDGVKCTGYRLPTEAEWEYAARAPATTMYAGSNNVDEVAWYDLNSGKMSHPVKSKKANDRGLYDLSGNVWEWVWDWYQANYQDLPRVDPIGPGNGSSRVARGGAWASPEPRFMRVAARTSSTPTIFYSGWGIRLARSLP